MLGDDNTVARVCICLLLLYYILEINYVYMYMLIYFPCCKNDTTNGNITTRQIFIIVESSLHLVAGGRLHLHHKPPLCVCVVGVLRH